MKIKISASTKEEFEKVEQILSKIPNAVKDDIHTAVYENSKCVLHIELRNDATLYLPRNITRIKNNDTWLLCNTDDENIKFEVKLTKKVVSYVFITDPAYYK